MALIDFDRLQMAAPERDISYWGAWTWVTVLISGRRPSWQVADALALAYSDVRPQPTTDRSTTAFYRALALLRIAHGWSALQAAPQTSALVLREALLLTSG